MTLSTHALAHLLLLALTLPAFVALMLAMERHQEDLLGHCPRSPPGGCVWRAGGCWRSPWCRPSGCRGWRWGW